MIEAYAIGVNLVLQSNSQNELTKLIEAFRAIDAAAKSAAGSIKEMSAAMRGMGAAAAAMNAAADAMGKAERAARGAAAGAAGFAGASDSAAAGAERAARAWAQTAVVVARARDAASMPAGSGGGAAGGGGGRSLPPPGGGGNWYYGAPMPAGGGGAAGGGGGAMPPPGAAGGGAGGGLPPPGGGAGGRPPPWGYQPLPPFPSPGAPYRMPAGGGYQAAAGAIEGYEILKSMFRDSAEVENEVQRMKATLLNDAQIEFAKSLARALVRQVPGAGYAETLKLFNETQATTRDFGTTVDILPDLARDAQILSGFGQGNPLEAIRSAIKSGELIGLTDANGKMNTAKLIDFVNKLVSVVVSSQGALDVSKYLTGIRQFGMGADSASMDFLTAAVPVYQQILGNSRAGTAMASLQQSLLSQAPNTQNKNVREEQIRIGMRDKQGNLVDKEELEHDINGYFLNFLLPLFVSKGFDSVEKIQEELSLVLNRQTTQRLAAAGLDDRAQIAKEITANLKQEQAGTGPLDAFLRDAPTAQWKAFTEAFKEFMSQLGSSVMPIAIEVLRGMTDALHTLSQAMADHPNAARDIVAFTAAVTGLLAISASFSIIGAAFALFAPGTIAAAGAAALAAILSTIGSIFGLFRGATMDDKATRGANDKMNDIRRGMGNPLDPLGPPQDGYSNGAGPRQQSYVPPANDNRGGLVHTAIYMDGRAIADTVTAYQTRDASAPSIGPSLYDPSITQPWPHHDWTA